MPPAGGSGSGDGLCRHAHSQRCIKRSLAETAESALHRSAGSSTELAALDAEDSPTSTASGLAVSLVSAEGGRSSQSGKQHGALTDGETPHGTPPSGPACQLPSSQQSSATAGPDELKAAGCEGEHRLEQASSRSRLAWQASDRVSVSDGRGDADAPRDGARPALHEVAAFQHPSAGAPMGRGRRAHSDIVCDVQFSIGGDLIATAGVGKQVSNRLLSLHI